MKIFLSPWMRELDDLTVNKIGIPSIVLMENAAQGAVNFISEEFRLSDFPNCLVLVGKGNNGGDGLAAGRILQQKGYHVFFLLLFPPSHFQGDSHTNFGIIQNLHMPYAECQKISQVKKIFTRNSPKDTFVIDAIFGTGIHHPIKEGLAADAIHLLNGSGYQVAALDVPSGLSDSFLPEEGSHVQATITPTFGGLKWSLLHPDGNIACGKIGVIDIGIPAKLTDNPKYYIHLIEPCHFFDLFTPRPVHAHKGNFGHVLSIAGSAEKPGAGILSAFSALKIGAGLVTAAIPFENRPIYIKAHPELMTLPYSRPEELEKRMNDFDCILAGPGLGIEPQNNDLLPMLLRKSNSPVILDADALNILAGRSSLLRGTRRFPLVLTPHPGEFARLVGLSTAQIAKERIQLSREFACRNRLFLILKGHHTLIATPEGNVHVNQTGNAGMAKAGSGDILSGIIAGLIAQFAKKHDLEKILQAAVFLHGYAADQAVLKKGEMTLMATDIIKAIPDSIRHIHDFQSAFHFS